MTTYTVYSAETGTIYGHGLHPTATMEILLSSNSRAWELRRDEPNSGWSLFTGEFDGTMKRVGSDVGYSGEIERAAALDAIAPRVLAAITGARHPREWTDMQFMDDEEFAEMVADTSEGA